MKKNEHCIGKTFTYQGLTLKVVIDDPQRESNCAYCELEDDPACNEFPCNFEDRVDKEDVHFVAQ